MVQKMNQPACAESPERSWPAPRRSSVCAADLNEETRAPARGEMSGASCTALSRASGFVLARERHLRAPGPWDWAPASRPGTAKCKARADTGPGRSRPSCSGRASQPENHAAASRSVLRRGTEWPHRRCDRIGARGADPVALPAAAQPGRSRISSASIYRRPALTLCCGGRKRNRLFYDGEHLGLCHLCRDPSSLKP
jgi:hypothetical protein